MHGSKTWPMKMECELKWMCWFTLKEKKANAELRELWNQSVW